MLNKVQIIGRMGKDPEIRAMQSGEQVASFSVATSERWKDKASGEYKEKTQWHNVVVFNQNLVRFIESYVTKGALVYVEGALETRKWQDKSGQDKYSTEIVLKAFNGEIKLLDKKETNSEGEYTTPKAHESGTGAFEDDIPFNSVKFICNI